MYYLGMRIPAVDLWEISHLETGAVVRRPRLSGAAFSPEHFSGLLLALVSVLTAVRTGALWSAVLGVTGPFLITGSLSPNAGSCSSWAPNNGD